MKRAEAIRVIGEVIKDELVIASNGMISREVFTYKDRKENFYMIGSMGLASPIGLGVAMNSKRKVVVVEGDGNMLMNMGCASTIGNKKPKNFLQIVLDNSIYDSTGGQPTNSMYIKLEEVARAAGYKNIKKVEDEESLKKAVAEMLEKEGPSFILAKVEQGNVEGVERVSHNPEEIKRRFMEAIE